MKFVLLVEGDAEQAAIAVFLKRWLDPRLTNPVGIKPVNFHGNARLLRKIVPKALDYLEGPDAGEIIAVIGLLDLYGLDIYPPELSTANERYEWAVTEFERRVGDPKFRMFFAVHEFEAWILAQPDVLPPAVQDGLPGSMPNPERVDFHEPPAKLLNRVYLSRMQKNYKKTTYGRQLLARLSPDLVADKCPYLKRMLVEMLRLAQEASR